MADDGLLQSLYDRGLNDAEIARQAATTKDKVRHWRLRNSLKSNTSSKPAEPEPAGFTESPEEATLVSTPGIRTLDELLDATDVDLNTWAVDRYVVNKWEVGALNKETGKVEVTELFQVKAWLKRNREAQEMSDIADRIVLRMMQHSPVYPDYVKPDISGERYMLEVSPFDLHIGKLAWAAETGDNYDSRIARQLLMNAVDDLLLKASGFPVERILFPIGNDLLHTDTTENTTTGGTRQDVDSRYHKMFVAAYDVMVAAIDRLMQVAPVKVLVVPGNHDRANALKLGVVLEAHYRNTERVTVDAAPTLRKYETYGVNLLGFTHGSDEKHGDLPLIMAQEKPVEWSKALHKEWHLGHLHKRKQQNFTAGDTHGGVPVRILPSLSGTDAWHYMRGYVKGQRAAEAYLWSFETGYAGHFSSNVLPKKRAA
jgi:hypothetical protein